MSGVSRERYFKNGDRNGMEHVGVNNLFGLCMTQILASTKIESDKITYLETILATPDDAETGYIVELDLMYPDKTKEKRK